MILHCDHHVYYYKSKLHETGKRFQVSETGTVRNRPPKNGNVQGNVVHKKIKKYVYVYIVFFLK